MILEPQCDMDLNVYKDWLADQGHDELRDIDFASLTTGIYFPLITYTHFLGGGLGGDEVPVGNLYGRNQCDDWTHEESGQSYGSNFFTDAAYHVRRDALVMSAVWGHGHLYKEVMWQEDYDIQLLEI